ncbi:Hypothetical protein P9301_13541 [Prochlorococcus marinus str. MIT 9301]|jgi:hypothetical protein|uniref:TVP38/TMEM64 family membrane protein n=1 Tax=Prochlorococcus marinus (strain MIT 9301) TaxID=167546 RepID=A3PE02_PROM0|nr:Hypothetical protein P9301_13541 [Prochlorococcus marinus str. MIT 9301]
MNRKGLNFKSAIFKIFYTYLGVYFLALIFKYNYDLELLFNNIQYKYLIALNIVFIFLGIPLSIIFDFILLKVFGFIYILLFSPALTILSVIQVLILRKIKFKFSRNILFLKRPEKNNLYKFFDNITFRSFYILIIRSFPILPHVLGSYIIASSKIKNKVILINTFFGSFFYYVFLYLIIGNV